MTRDQSDPSVIIALGFTGTQRDLTLAQHTMLKIYLAAIWEHKNPLGLSTLVEAHHGDCIGADTTFHTEAVSRDFKITIHPPLNTKARAWNLTSGKPLTIMPPRPYSERNHNIVDACHELIACPYEMEEILRSGTWSTTRYARKVKREIFIIFPDGSTKHEKGPRHD